MRGMSYSDSYTKGHRLEICNFWISILGNLRFIYHIYLVEKPEILTFYKILTSQLDQSPAILTSDDFIRSNEIVRTKWPIY